jgi:hypothetical protein
MLAVAMAKKKQPRLSEYTWFMREVLDPGTPVASVTCAEGCILVGGARVFRVGPGTWDVQYRGLPAGTEMPISIAMEPRPPFRVAVGPESGDVIIFTDTTTSSSVTGHTFTAQRGAKQAMELAWVVNEGQSSLFARTDDGGLYRMQTEGWDTLEMPPVRAIARDSHGGFAALTVVDGEPKAYLSYDGAATFAYRSLGVEVEAEPDAHAALALANGAVAVAVGDSGPMVSRGSGAVTTRHAGLGRAYALAFQGGDPDGWLFVALQRSKAEPAAVWILDADGSSIKVMDFLADDDEPLELGPIAWDSARKALVVSSRGGLIAMGPEAPKRPRAKKPLTQ